MGASTDAGSSAAPLVGASAGAAPKLKMLEKASITSGAGWAAGVSERWEALRSRARAVEAGASSDQVAGVWMRAEGVAW